MIRRATEALFPAVMLLLIMRVTHAEPALGPPCGFWLEDQNGDGYHETFFSDWDMDGHPEWGGYRAGVWKVHEVWEDLDDDGQYDEAEFDVSGDQIADIVRRDIDGDGELDVEWRGLGSGDPTDDGNGEIDPGECEPLPDLGPIGGPHTMFPRQCCDKDKVPCAPVPLVAGSCETATTAPLPASGSWGAAKARYR